MNAPTLTAHQYTTKYLNNFTMAPKVSIITVCFNAKAHIEKTILSIINQTYNNIEFIIIDGGSTDGTINIIKKYNEYITFWNSEPDKGVYDAMNKGIIHSTGEWINFMNAGDSFYKENTIESFIEKIPKGTDIAYGDTMINLSIGNFLEKPKPLNKINEGMIFGHQATFIRSKIHKSNLFDLTYKLSADYNFFYTAYKRNYTFSYIPIIVANYEGENGLSSKNHFLSRKENAKIQGKSHKLSWILSFKLHFYVFQIKNIIKHLLPKNIIYDIKIYNLKRTKRYSKF